MTSTNAITIGAVSRIGSSQGIKFLGCQRTAQEQLLYASPALVELAEFCFQVGIVHVVIRPFFPYTSVQVQLKRLHCLRLYVFLSV